MIHRRHGVYRKRKCEWNRVPDETPVILTVKCKRDELPVLAAWDSWKAESWPGSKRDFVNQLPSAIRISAGKHKLGVRARLCAAPSGSGVESRKLGPVTREKSKVPDKLRPSLRQPERLWIGMVYGNWRKARLIHWICSRRREYLMG